MITRKMPSGHNRAAVHRNALRFWQHAKVLYKVKPDQSQLERGDGYEIRCLAEELLVIDRERLRKV